MHKKMERPQDSKMLGGVCAGFADYMELDKSLLRLLFIGITLVTAVFPMLLFYLIAWVIIPPDIATVRG
ncbi:PspC domain-containing protein [Acidobacteriota bacterium]